MRYRATFDARSLSGMLALAVGAACVDELPVQSKEQPRPTTGELAMAAIPVDSIVGNALSLAVAREVPSYAGMYFDEGGTLVVATTDPARLSEASQRVRSRLSTHNTSRAVVGAQNVRMTGRQVRYSYLQLARYRTVLRRHVFEIPAVVTLGVRESENRVRIGITDRGAEGAVRQVLTKVGVPEGAVAIVQAGVARDASHLLTGTMGNIQGGWEINSTTQICTLGIAARRASDWAPVFVTVSHCTATSPGFDGGTIHQDGTHIGNEIADPATWNCAYSSDCRHSDAALISAIVPLNFGTIARTTSSSNCEFCAAPLTINHTTPSFPITAASSYIIEGETLHKVGITTGWTYGQVVDTCVDAATSGWIKMCSEEVDFSTDGGDSGAPVFSLNAGGSTVTFKGMVFAASNFLGNHSGYMSNIQQIQNDLGGLVFFDPGAPIVQITGPTEAQTGSNCRYDAQVLSGLAPFTAIQWSGLLSGSAWSVEGSLYSSGQLQAAVTDRLGRVGAGVISVSVHPSNPLCSEA